MLRFAKHIKLASSLFVTLFVVGSSGVAFVLQTCAMPSQMACCQMMDSGVTSECTGQSQTNNAVALKSDMSCNTTTVVGGYTTNPGVVESNHPVLKAPLVAAPLSDVVFSIAAVQTEIPLSPFVQSSSPPSVAKHILNATLLI